jgi:hypothetical protein
MSVIDFTQDEGLNPNDKPTMRHAPLKRNEAKCSICWRIFFKGELVKFRIVNGTTMRGLVLQRVQIRINYRLLSIN